MKKTADDKNARAAEIEAAVRKADAENNEDAGTKLDKILAGLDSVSDRFESLEERLDAIEAQAPSNDRNKHGSKDDAKDFKQPGQPVAPVADEDPDDMDEQGRSSLLAQAQERCDSVALAFGQNAPPPMSGERTLNYRKRLLRPFQRHCKQFAEVNLDAVNDSAVFSGIEASIYADALVAANRPESYTGGELREVKRRDSAGRIISTFYGNRTFIREFASSRRRVSGIRNAE